MFATSGSVFSSHLHLFFRWMARGWCLDNLGAGVISAGWTQIFRGIDTGDYCR